MDKMIPDNNMLEEEPADLVYSFAGAPGVIPGQSGLILAARTTGLFRSEDGGQTWQDALASLPLSEPLPVTSLAVSPAFERDQHLYAGAPGGVLRSTDGGQTWTAQMLPPPPPTISALAISPAYEQDQTIFAGSMEDGVFISTNGGDHWVGWNFGLLDLNVMCLAISPRFAEDETVFAGTETGIFRSTNGGRAWREVDLPFGFDAILSLAFSPHYHEDHTIYAGTENNGLWASRDDGESWFRLAADVIDDPVNGLLVDSSSITAFTGQGLWRSGDGGLTWADLLPPGSAEREVSAVLAPQGLTPGALAVAGYADGEVEVFRIS